MSPPILICPEWTCSLRTSRGFQRLFQEAFLSFLVRYLASNVKSIFQKKKKVSSKCHSEKNFKALHSFLQACSSECCLLPTSLKQDLADYNLSTRVTCWYQILLYCTDNGDARPSLGTPRASHSKDEKGNSPISSGSRISSAGP